MNPLYKKVDDWTKTLQVIIAGIKDCDLLEVNQENQLLLKDIQSLYGRKEAEKDYKQPKKQSKWKEKRQF